MLFGWVWAVRPEKISRKAGWDSVISLPRVLTMAADGSIRYAPPEDLQVLRAKHVGLSDVPVSEGVIALETVNGDSLELIAEFEPGTSEKFGLALRRSPDGEEEALLTYRRRESTLTMERHRSSLDPEVWAYPCGGQLSLADGENLLLQIFLDHSVIEVFANGKLCLTSRIYPTRSDSLGVAAFAQGGSATLRRLEAWEIVP